MTKKDFILVAATIKTFLDNGDNDQLDGIGGADKLTRALADTFGQINPRFDRERFYKACGLY